VAIFLDVDDLMMFQSGLDPDKTAQMIDDAEAIAALAAPCLTDPGVDPTSPNGAAVKAILRGAVLRWLEAGSGAFQSQVAGPFGVTYDTRQERRGLFWPSEIVQLQRVCLSVSPTGGGGAFSIDTKPASVSVVHLDTCDFNFGGNDCTCGALLASGTLL
jgi:hypothetical protein